MALFPCDVSNHRYQGRQQTMYPAIVDGGDAARRKLRLCPHHFDHFEQTLLLRFQNAQVSFSDALKVCCGICGLPVADSTFQMFVTVYAQGQERADYWAPLHAGCVTSALEDWQLPVDVHF